MAGCYSRKEALWLLSQSFCFYPITPTRKTYSPPKRLLLHTHFYTEHPLSSRVDACKRAEAHECMHNPAVCSFACCECKDEIPALNEAFNSSSHGRLSLIHLHRRCITVIIIIIRFYTLPVLARYTYYQPFVSLGSRL